MFATALFAFWCSSSSSLLSLGSEKLSTYSFYFFVNKKYSGAARRGRDFLFLLLLLRFASAKKTSFLHEQQLSLLLARACRVRGNGRIYVHDVMNKKTIIHEIRRRYNFPASCFCIMFLATIVKHYSRHSRVRAVKLPNQSAGVDDNDGPDALYNFMT